VLIIVHIVQMTVGCSFGGQSSALEGLSMMEDSRRLPFSRGLVVGSSRRFHFPDPNVERPLVRIGMCPSTARHRLDIVSTICAFIRSLR